jgi:hypothetical protein
LNKTLEEKTLNVLDRDSPQDSKIYTCSALLREGASSKNAVGLSNSLNLTCPMQERLIAKQIPILVRSLNYFVI